MFMGNIAFQYQGSVSSYSVVPLLPLGSAGFTPYVELYVLF